MFLQTSPFPFLEIGLIFIDGLTEGDEASHPGNARQTQRLGQAYRAGEDLCTGTLFLHQQDTPMAAAGQQANQCVLRVTCCVATLYVARST